MKTFLIAAFGILLFSSCSTYKNVQTPDDMYYTSSPNVVRGAAGSDEYMPADGTRNDGRYNPSSTYNGYDDYATSDDRWLMMRVRDRARWSVFDDYNYYSPYSDFAYGGLGGYGMGYGYSPGFSLGYGGGFYSPYSSFGLGLGLGGFGYGYFNNYYNWNTIYNPYYYNAIVVNPKLNPAGYTTVRNFNLGGYANRTYNSTSKTTSRPNYNGYVSPNTNTNRIYSGGSRQYNTSGSTRRVYSNSTLSGGNNSQSYDRPVRSYSPSNNSSYTPRSSGVSGGGYSGGGGGGSSSGGGGRPSRR